MLGMVGCDDGEGEKSKSLRHPEFPGSPPPKYYSGSTVLIFGDRTRSGVFTVIWP